MDRCRRAGGGRRGGGETRHCADAARADAARADAARAPVDPAAITYTQWEYWLARYYNKPCFVYTVSAEAQREKDYKRTDEQAAAQRTHLDYIRNTGQFRGPVTGDWHLVARVLLSLRHEHPGAFAGEKTGTGKPGGAAVVISLQPAGIAYVLRGALRWRGLFQSLTDDRRLETLDGEALTVLLTQAVEHGAEILRENAPAEGLTVELVLPTGLLFERGDRWCKTGDSVFDGPRPVPLRERFPLRLRNADRWGKNSIVLDINRRRACSSRTPRPRCRSTPPRAGRRGLPRAVAGRGGGRGRVGRPRVVEAPQRGVRRLHPQAPPTAAPGRAGGEAGRPPQAGAGALRDRLRRPVPGVARLGAATHPPTTCACC